MSLSPSNTSPLRVLIVGASIAGPTAAYWFARAGHNVTIIERFPALRKGGQSIDIRTVGVSVMRKIPGMEAAVRAARAPIDGFALIGRDGGKPFATFLPTGDADKQSMISEYEIFRGDLNKILFDLTSEDKRVKYVFGEQVSALHQKPDSEKDGDGPLTVEFLNGYPTQEFDLVVAADGATSRTRAMGLGGKYTDYAKSLYAWGAYFTIEKDFLAGSKVGHAFTATPGRVIAIGADHDLQRNRGTMMSIHRPGDDAGMQEFRDASKKGTIALRDHVAKRFGNMGWKTNDLIAVLPDTDDGLYGSEMVSVAVPSITKGRFVLLGDAAHASGPTGTGTSLAMAGAYLLAGEICKHGADDVAAGLAGFRERMAPLIKEMTVIPPFFPHIMAPQSEARLILRNTLIWAVFQAMQTFGFVGTFFGWIGGLMSSAFATVKNDLPDYDWPVAAEDVGGARRSGEEKK